MVRIVHPGDLLFWRMRLAYDVCIEGGPPGLPVAISSGLLKLFGGERGDDHLVTKSPALGKNVSEWID